MIYEVHFSLLILITKKGIWGSHFFMKSDIGDYFYSFMETKKKRPNIKKSFL